MGSVERIESLESISSGPFYYYKILTGHPYNIIVPIVCALLLAVLSWKITKRILKKYTYNKLFLYQYILSNILYVCLMIVFCFLVILTIGYFTPFWLVAFIFYGLQVIFPLWLLVLAILATFRQPPKMAKTFDALPNVLQIIGTSLAALILCISYIAWFVEPYDIEVTKAKFQMTKEVPELKIVHLTDIQTDVKSQREEDVVRMVNAEKPDVIVITGDYFNGTKETNPKGFESARYVLSNIRAKYGMYAVSSDSNPLWDHKPLFSGLPISYLENKSERIEVDGKNLFIIGVSRRYPNIDLAFEKVPDNAAKILIYHGPEIFFDPEIKEHKPDLVLVGHTHGGQVAMPLIGPLTSATPYGRKMAKGWFQKDGMHMYVNRGIGLEGQMAPKIRYLARPEVAVIHISGT